jgi:hypothetical protein
VSELNILLTKIKQADAKTVDDVKKVVDGYFEELVFSLLKSEWTQMTSKQKDEFLKSVFNNIIK